MSSQGPYGRQGYQSNPQGYGGGYGGGGYSAPPYGQGAASYSAPAPQAGTYGVGASDGGGIDVGGYGAQTAGDYQVRS